MGSQMLFYSGEEITFLKTWGERKLADNWHPCIVAPVVSHLRPAHFLLITIFSLGFQYIFPEIPTYYNCIGITPIMGLLCLQLQIISQILSRSHNSICFYLFFSSILVLQPLWCHIPGLGILLSLLFFPPGFQYIFTEIPTYYNSIDSTPYHGASLSFAVDNQSKFKQIS